jgi:hypothetical protein
MNTLKRACSPGALCLLALVVLAGASAARSQNDLEKTLRQNTSATVSGYIQPVADMFGANMHTGYYHTADVEKWGLHISLDFVAMGAMVKDDQKNYSAPAPAGFNPGTFQTATLFGGKGTEVTDVRTGLKFRGSDGIINASYFPLAVPQLTIGNIYGTQAMIRFVTLPASLSNGKLPAITLWGLGARHSISQYIPKFPVDLAAGLYFNSFTFGDMIDFKGVALNAQASKSWSILTVYGGLQWEQSKMTLSYISTDVSAPPVDITLDGANAFRFTAGLALGLGPLKLFGDVNFGSVTTLSAGFGFGN